MACCLMAPSHYLNQCWLIISEVQWHSYWGNSTRDASTIIHYDPFENQISKISFKFPRGRWVNFIYSNRQVRLIYVLLIPCGFLMALFYQISVVAVFLNACCWIGQFLKDSNMRTFAINVFAYHMLMVCNKKYPSQTHLKLKSHKISFAYNIHLNNPIVLNFCTEHGSITAMLCAKFHNNWTTEIDIMDERHFTRFWFTMNLQTYPWLISLLRCCLTYVGGHIVEVRWLEDYRI